MPRPVSTIMMALQVQTDSERFSQSRLFLWNLRLHESSGTIVEDRSTGVYPCHARIGASRNKSGAGKVLWRTPAQSISTRTAQEDSTYYLDHYIEVRVIPYIPLQSQSMNLKTTRMITWIRSLWGPSRIPTEVWMIWFFLKKS